MRDLTQALHGMVLCFAERFGVDRADAAKFASEVYEDCFGHIKDPKDILESLDGVAALCSEGSDMCMICGAGVAALLWTSSKRLEGPARLSVELCQIINFAVRSDSMALLHHAVPVLRLINSHLTAVRLGGHAVWPNPSLPGEVANTTYRGGSMPLQHRNFFKVGVWYRSPGYVATSFSEHVAGGFAARGAENPPPGTISVMWVLHYNAAQRTANARYLAKALVTHAEKEFLIVPYTAFTVRRVDWKASPHAIIEVDVGVNNLKDPEDLPLAPHQ